jgi:hypothetical protein
VDAAALSAKRLVVVGVAVVVALASAAVAQTRCDRQGEYLHCDDGRVFYIYPDRLDGRPGRGGPSPWGGLGREARGYPENLPPEGREYLYGPDALVCFPHGTHVHCNQ